MKKILLNIVVLLPALLLLNGCHAFGTHTPKPKRASQPTFSTTPDSNGDLQTSGVWGFTTNWCAVIDQSGRELYNSYIVRGLGVNLNPPVKDIDWGLSRYTNNPIEPLFESATKVLPSVPNPGNLFILDPRATEKFGAMAQQSLMPPKASPP